MERGLREVREVREDPRRGPSQTERVHVLQVRQGIPRNRQVRLLVRQERL